MLDNADQHFLVLIRQAAALVFDGRVDRVFISRYRLVIEKILHRHIQPFSENGLRFKAGEGLPRVPFSQPNRANDLGKGLQKV